MHLNNLLIGQIDAMFSHMSCIFKYIKHCNLVYVGWKLHLKCQPPVSNVKMLNVSLITTLHGGTDSQELPQICVESA